VKHTTAIMVWAIWSVSEFYGCAGLPGTVSYQQII